ncbi:ACT domain-containing protein [Phragmitibacter flavus]|uniref:Bifunctional chorismate mutase/prephenate dehydratase n=1 Tax=Phragmitibacter flavus TaxID=2576071 RepID=A0A5R8KGU9_9BACT|nr:bifunctional chorismate mutase/prephenate dehydratase [Phragmitibacter flavus]TLD71195.1 ACT domain-containing protein [Phragmitibacter flavus]
MSLEDIRTKIDRVDRELLKFLNERADLVHQVGEIKRKEGLEIYAPDREEKLLLKLIELNQKHKGRLPEKSIRAIYREIISAALALEQDLRIGYLGPAGSWTHQAAISRFGNSVLYVSEASTEDVFECVNSQEADYGVLPIEHSTEGAVHHTLDHLVDSPLQIYSQFLWRTETVLMSNGSRDTVDYIYGHPQVIAQCRKWLTVNFPDAELREAPSTSQAAAFACEHPASAALGTALGAELQGLKIIASSIDDSASQARFIILGRRPAPATGNDNTLLMVTAHDKVGALFEILEAFVKQGINVRHIENRPVTTDEVGLPSRVRFFLEVTGHCHDEGLKKAQEDVGGDGAHIKILGSYPVSNWGDRD